MNLGIKVMMILDQSSQTIQAIKLLSPVIMIANVSYDLFQHIFRRGNWSQFFFRHVLSSLVIDMMVFFLHI